MSWGGNRGRGHHGSPNRQVNNWNRGYGHQRGDQNFRREQWRNSDSRNRPYPNYGNDLSGGHNRNSDRYQQHTGTYNSQSGSRRSGSVNRDDSGHVRTADALNSRKYRTGPKDREDRSRSRSRSSERGHFEGESRSSSRESSIANRSAGSDGTHDGSARPSPWEDFLRQKTPNRGTGSDSAQDGSSKPNAWDEFLRKKAQEEDKNAQKSQRTKDYATERNISIKSTNQPTEISTSTSRQFSGNTSTVVLEDELNLDDLIGGGSYAAGDDMSDNLSQISTISTVCNPRGLEFSVTITYMDDKFHCGECTFKDKAMSVTIEHVKVAHTKKANIIRYKCGLCKFGVDNLRSWELHQSMSSHQLEVEKHMSSQSDKPKERRNQVDEGGFAVPRSKGMKPSTKTSSHGTKQTGVNDPWAKQEARRTISIWDQRSSKRVGDKIEPWNKSKENSSKSPDVSTDSMQDKSKSGGSAIVFDSRSIVPVKSPPWAKKPLLDLNSLPVTAVKGILQQKPETNTTQSSSIVEPQLKSTVASSVSPDTRQISSSSRSSQTTQKNVSSDVIKQSMQHNTVTKSVSSSKCKESPRPATSESRNSGSFRNLPSSFPRRKSVDRAASSPNIAPSQNLQKSNSATRTSVSLPVYTTSTASGVSTTTSASHTSRSRNVGDTSSSRNNDISLNQTSHKFSNSTRTAISLPVSTSATSSVSTTISKSRSRDLGNTSSSGKCGTAPMHKTNSNTRTVNSSSVYTSGTTSRPRDSGNTSSSANSGVTVSSKTTPVTSVTNSLHKSASGSISRSSHIKSPNGQVSPVQKLSVSPDQRSPISQGLRFSYSSGNKPVQGSSSGKDTDKTRPSSKQDKLSEDRKRYSIPKVNPNLRSTATSTSTTTTTKTSFTTSTSKTVPSKSAQKSTPSVLPGDILSSIVPDLPFSSSKESRSGTSAEANKSKNTTLSVKTPAVDINTSTKVTQVAPTVKQTSRLPTTTHHSRQSAQTSHTQVSSAASRDGSRYSSGHRARHSSGSTGSASPLDTRKSPSDREARKESSTGRILGIKERNAAYDPRDNCVPLQPNRYPKPGPKTSGVSSEKPGKELSTTKQAEETGYVQAMKSSSSAPSFSSLSNKSANTISSLKRPERRTVPSATQVQEHIVKIPAVIQDPRKVTHSSKLAKGAVIAKPLTNFKIPKQKSRDILDDDDTEQITEVVDKYLATKSSPEKIKDKSGKDVDKQRRKSVDKVSREEKNKPMRVDSGNKGISSTKNQTVSAALHQSSGKETSQSTKGVQDKTNVPVRVGKATSSNSVETAEAVQNADNSGKTSNEKATEKKNVDSQDKDKSSSADKAVAPTEKSGQTSTLDDLTAHSTDEMVDLVPNDETTPTDAESTHTSGKKVDPPTVSTTTDASDKVRVGEHSGREEVTTTESSASSEKQNERNPQAAAEISEPQVKRARNENSFIEIDATGRMFCWKCGGKMFPKCASTVISTHLQQMHMNLTTATYDCIPCNFSATTCRSFKTHMITQDHSRNLKLALSRPRPSDDHHEMINLGTPSTNKETPSTNIATPSSIYSPITVKVEEGADSTGQINSNDQTDATGQSGTTNKVVQLFLKVENDDGNNSDDHIAQKDVKASEDAQKKDELPSITTQKPPCLEKCTCPAESYPHMHCPECRQTGKSPSKVRSHRLTAHGIIPEGHELYSSVSLYPSQLKKHLMAHIKKEQNKDALFVLQARLEEVEALIRPRKQSTKNVVRGPGKKRPIKVPRVKFYRQGAGKRLVWYRYRKRKLLKNFGLISSGQYTMKVRDERRLRKYRFVKDNQIMYKCDKCSKIRKTTSGFKYHMFAFHKGKGRFMSKRNKRSRAKATSSERKESDKRKRERSNSVEGAEKAIILGFLHSYRKGDRYYCDKCGYNNILRKQLEFREHLFKDHNIYHPDLRRLECTTCKPVFRTVKQTKIEAHVHSPQHIKLEKEAAGITSIEDVEKEIDEPSPTSRRKRTHLMQVACQYRIGTSYGCPQCGKKVENINHFVNHMYCEHKVKLSTKDCTYYECSDCSPPFRTSFKNKFKKHQQCARHIRALELNKGTKRSNSEDIDDEPVRKKPKVANDGANKAKKSLTVSLLQSEEFVCNLCNSNFTAINNVGNHLDTKHKQKLERFKYECQFCECTERTLIDFREHMKAENHELEVALARSRAEYESSRNKVPAIEDNEADEVSSVESSSSDESESEEISSTVFKVTKNGMNCESCDFTTTTFDEIMKHIQRYHKETENLTFSCETCGFENSSVKEIMVHVTTDAHENKMKSTFEEYVKVTTSLAYKITKKNKIMCLTCKREIKKMERILTHAEEKHQLSTTDMRVYCRVCDEILSPENVQKHRKSAKHDLRVNADGFSSDTDACPPAKKLKLEEVDNSDTENNSSGRYIENVAGPSGKTNTSAPQRTQESSTVTSSTQAAQSQQLEEQLESVPPEDDIGPDPFEQPSSPEEAIEIDQEDVVHHPAPLAPEPPQQDVEAAAQQHIAGNAALNAQPSRQPHLQITLADFTSEELLEELTNRDDFLTCACGFAYYNDRVAFHLHKGCHSVSDWHKCRNCFRTFPDAYKFTTHFLEGHREERSQSTNF